MSAITTIVFDFGGVLFRGDEIRDIGTNLANKYGISADQVNTAIIPAWFAALVDPQQDDAFWKTVATSLGAHPDAIFREFADQWELIPETVALVRALAPTYRVAMLSNQISSLHGYLMNQYQLQDLFSPIITSYGERMKKPDEQIYFRLLDQLDTKPGKCVFIDDREENITTAEKIGMQGILFETPEHVTARLREMGINC